MATLDFRRFKREDEAGVSRVIRDVLNVNHDAAYWEWKYFYNPAGEHMVTVALDNNEVVGVQGYLAGRIKCGSKVLLSAQNIDMAVLARYRSGGTFLTMHEKAMEKGPRKKAALCYGFPNETAYRLASCLEYTGVCPIFNLTKVLNPVPYIQQKIGKRLPIQSAGIIGKRVMAWLYKRRLALYPDSTTLVEVERFDRGFDEFWDREADHYPIAVIRDSAYLNWRYVDCPSAYKIFCVEKDHSVKGFIVLKYLKDKGVKRGKIVDILVEWGHNAVAEQLLDQGMSYFADQNVDVVSTWVFDHWPIFAAFIKKGFSKRKAPHYLVVNAKAVDIPGEYFFDSSRWYVTMGDSDYC